MMRKLVTPAAVIVLILVAWWAASGMFLPLGGEGSKIVDIPKGASAGRIGRILAEHRVIRSAVGFNMLARLTNKSSSLKPGAYRLSPSMPPGEIMDTIVKGEVCARWITIPEGFTVRQIAERLAARGLVNEERFLYLASNGRYFDVGFPHGDNLEGYLFPDTYLIPLDSAEESVIRQMLDCFRKKAMGCISSSQTNMPLDEVVILASMIEREARVPKDRPLVSAVLRNRLNRGMRLEVDATVLYALGRHKTRVLYSDLDVDSPYNTYRNAGLPPGAIANPGLDCIKAALNPARVDYLYYVAKPDGSHIFSRTLAEHDHAKRIAQRAH
jgi:UPF0755 protein